MRFGECRKKCNVNASAYADEALDFFCLKRRSSFSRHYSLFAFCNFGQPSHLAYFGPFLTKSCAHLSTWAVLEASGAQACLLAIFTRTVVFQYNFSYIPDTWWELSSRIVCIAMFTSSAPLQLRQRHVLLYHAIGCYNQAVDCTSLYTILYSEFARGIEVINLQKPGFKIHLL